MRTGGLTRKGAATRARIVEAAADRVLARGVGGTSLEDIGADTATSKSQLFHYFPGGKHELVQAIVACQGDRLLEAQRPAIDRLGGWEGWDEWRRLVLAHYTRAAGVAGCPIGSLANEVAPIDPVLRAQLRGYFEEWQRRLEAGVASLRENDLVRADVDAPALAVSLLAAIQGGLLLSQVQGTLEPLERSLDAALAHLRAQAA